MRESSLTRSMYGCPQIWEWTRAFCEGTKASGQLCFDFMKDGEDGKLYAFECNPRASTILLNFYDQPVVAAAFFNPQVRARCPLWLASLGLFLSLPFTPITKHV